MAFGFRAQQRGLLQVIAAFQEIEEILMAGLVPTARNWEALKGLEEPWKNLAVESLKELRDQGGSILPTLKRLRGLAESHRVALEEARAKASQAFAQAMACSLLVPLLGSALYALLPGVEENAEIWVFACLVALLFTLMGCLWLLNLALSARWGGLSSDRRSWVLAAQCAGERFLALVRVGTPPDLAWVNACQFLAQEGGGLSLAWGNSIWDNPEFRCLCRVEELLVGVAVSIKKTIQVSLMEGRPCVERVEAALLGLRQDLKAEIERELTLLPTRALKPLFIFVAPALLGLLFCGLWLAGADVLEGF